MPPKSRVTAALLSLFIPGLGHVYLGVVLRAFLFLVLPPLLALAIATVVSEASPGVMVAAFVLVLGMTRIAAAADTLLVPREKHRALPTAAIVGLVVGGLIVVQVTAFALRGSVMEAFKVPSGAMIPSILVGDHFFVDKVVYRKRDPRRGEVMVFKYPEHPDQSFVKRVVGVGCDLIEVRDGVLHVNKWPVPRCRVGKWTYAEPIDATKHVGDLYVEYLEDAAYYVFLDETSHADVEQGPYEVKSGETFVMGDNRNNAYDSRMWFGGAGGGVPRANVQGRARMLWLSPMHGRLGGDLAELGPPPSGELTQGISACLAARPPRAKTSPPSSKRDCR